MEINNINILEKKEKQKQYNKKSYLLHRDEKRDIVRERVKLWKQKKALEKNGINQSRGRPPKPSLSDDTINEITTQLNVSLKQLEATGNAVFKIIIRLK